MWTVKTKRRQLLFVKTFSVFLMLLFSAFVGELVENIVMISVNRKGQAYPWQVNNATSLEQTLLSEFCELKSNR